jgi:hypothetical protein
MLRYMSNIYRTPNLEVIGDCCPFFAVVSDTAHFIAYSATRVTSWSAYSWYYIIVLGVNNMLASLVTLPMW